MLLAVFVLQKSPHAEVAMLQDQMMGQFAVAWQEVIGDQPYFDDVALIFNSTGEFYVQSANATIALFEHGVTDHELAFIASGVYHNISAAVVRVVIGEEQSEESNVLASIGSEFMSEPAILNIVPANPYLSGLTVSQGEVAGEVIAPVNAETPWVTIQDNFTGQIYCLAIYNNEVNKYLGPCKYDYH